MIPEEAYWNKSSRCRASPRTHDIVSRLSIRPQMAVFVVTLGIAALGAVFVYINRDLPLVRNGETYARFADSLIVQGYDLPSVVADPAASCGKPPGFSMVSAPLVKVFGPNAGLRIGSFLGTICLLIVGVWCMARLNDVFGIDRRLLAWQQIALWCNPLMMYQFWSAYPDTIWAAAVVAVIVSFERLAFTKRGSSWTVVGLFMLVIASVSLKYYGTIVLVVLPVAGWLGRRHIKWSTRVPRSLAIGAMGVFVWLTLAFFGKNPFLHIAGHGGGFSDYLTSLADGRRIAVFTLLSALMFIALPLLVCNVASIVLIRRFALRASMRDPRRALYIAFACIYTLTLLPFPGTFYNPRYALPILPLLSVAVVASLARRSKTVRRGLLVACISIQIPLIANFNVPSVHARFAYINQTVRPLVDNLRMNAHFERRRALDHIAQRVPNGAVLYLVSNYYDGCVAPILEHLWRDVGFALQDGVEVRASTDLPAADNIDIDASSGIPPDVFVYADRVYTADRSRVVTVDDVRARGWTHVRALGHGLFAIRAR